MDTFAASNAQIQTLAVELARVKTVAGAPTFFPETQTAIGVRFLVFGSCLSTVKVAWVYLPEGLGSVVASTSNSLMSSPYNRPLFARDCIPSLSQVSPSRCLSSAAFEP